jgi:glycerophosphoryl diester phosphodiesterase
VPTLREVFKEFPDTRMVVEMKHAPDAFSPAVKLRDLIKEYGMEKKILVASFSERFMNEFRDLRSGVATSATISPGDLKEILSAAELKSAFKQLEDFHSQVGLPADDPRWPAALQVPYQLLKAPLFRKLTKRIVENIQRHNIKVHAWTVNRPVDMSLMRSVSVDGIITDYPGLLRAVLDQSPPA